MITPKEIYNHLTLQESHDIQDLILKDVDFYKYDVELLKKVYNLFGKRDRELIRYKCGFYDKAWKRFTDHYNQRLIEEILLGDTPDET